MRNTSIEEWTERIDQVTREVKEHFGSLGPDSLHWKASRDRWSIAENLRHLIVLNRSYIQVIDDHQRGKTSTPFVGYFRWIPRKLGSLLLKAVDPTSRKKRKTATLKQWTPEKQGEDENVIEAFRDHQAHLKERYQAYAELLDKNPVIHSPASRAVVLELRTVLEVLVRHEERHLAQAKELLEKLEDKANEGRE